ncbi:restriction endonuclease subunit S [Vibrio cholerae]|uniref:restriction endonuclease subunit S n=1 Tax=Vibrio cholerae TaxID=666 RepID=UPI000E0BC464|nr:restriction endonuclease subunit S [Vibrio cholerae]EGQ9833721.1 restriction endonuclease subunit S [Vibrio cholerae]EIC2298324.1 restriction endonuclease subunit S [Vibrio cholerae]EJL6470850.1 restriction endonuclease subunit S [Vibrio cholerae]EJL6716572.1 restriction endonuclease subunit S [Vibrio cholerae]EJL6911860.1 restriction endonuclease subunit S [Vibrio cholerae]
MGSNWKTARLLDQYEVRSGLSKPAKDFGTGYPFLTFKDVFYNYFTPEVLGDLVESTDKERDGCSVKRGDVFLTRTSETMNELGMSCVALKDYEGATFNGFCKRLRPNEQCELVPEYVGYYLRSPKFRQAMVAFSTMSTRASLNNEMIGRLEISYPPKEAQRHIAHVLKTLDNKITLNRQINQTLEQMAQTLFKSWFVDFDPVIDNALDAGNPIPDELQHRAEARNTVRESEGFKPLPDDVRQLFPDAFEESELGWVPKGWEFKYLNSISNITYGKNLPKSKILDNGYPVYGGNGIIGAYERYLYEKPQVLISCRGAASGKVHWTKPFSFVTNNSLVIEEQNVNSDFLYYSLLQQDLTTLTSGSAQPQMTIANLNPVQVLVPEQSLLSEFSKHAQMLMVRCEARSSECESLTKLRDTLLPKLISGELRLDEVELAVEQEAVSAEQQNER